jgi:predicted phage tail component-like protein
MGGFTFDGIHSSVYGIKAKIIRNLAPSTRDKEDDVPGRDGTWYFGTDLGKGQLEVECVAKGTSRAEFLSKVRQIAAWINPKKGERKLISDDEPDKWCMARYSGSIPLDQLVKAGKFTLPFAYSDPYDYLDGEQPFTATVTQSIQVIKIEKESLSVDEYPKITITNNGQTAVTNPTISRV